MKALITDEVHPLLMEGLKSRGYETTYQPNITFDEVVMCIASFDGLVINSKVYCGEPLLGKAAKLKWIARLGSGMEVIDKKACDQKQVKYFNSPEGNREAVAEHALGMLLNLMRNISRANSQIHHHEWQREANRGISLNGKTVGIIGFGNTGKAFAKTLSGFDVRILANDTYQIVNGTEQIVDADIATIQQEADIISFHLPLTAETHHFGNDSFFEKIKRPIFLLNTSRGKVIDTSALLRACAAGKILGAGLDVFENEHQQTFSEKEKAIWKALLNEERLLLTPHIAGWTFESKVKIAQTVLQKLDTIF